MPPTNIAASACTRHTGSVGANQRSPTAPQICPARVEASSPATRERRACASAVRAGANALVRAA